MGGISSTSPPFFAALFAMTPSSAMAQDVSLFAAGSLKAALSDVAAAFTTAAVTGSPGAV
ncbi:hypothetical protein [Sedimentitalea xiamensis]|nr:hypothetical protein [Sedimentitalea xiamensis]